MHKDISNAAAGDIYLDMIGGIAGDMFVAAMSDLDPDLESLCIDTVGRIAELPRDVQTSLTDYCQDSSFGKQFRVRSSNPQVDQHHHSHVGFRDAVRIVESSDLDPAVKDRAASLFDIIAIAEGSVHRLPKDEVMFHEVGGWDSIIDIILAATIAEYCSRIRWSCSAVPLGRGSVTCAHGVMPVPAPATVEILRGFRVCQDQFDGERVTPTGAAILRHLDPRQLSGMPPSRYTRVGTGWGSKSIPGLANSLRCYLMTDEERTTSNEIAVIEFDIDDQSPEDLAIGIEAIRSGNGVLDVTQMSYVGKKNRLGSTIRVLADPAALAETTKLCLSATSTIGLRHHIAERVVLHREHESIDDENLRIKRVTRPDGEVTVKIEAEDLAGDSSSFGRREKRRAKESYNPGKRKPRDDDNV